MATWEQPKMHSYHEASVWSLKPGDSSATAAAMSDPLSKSLLTALNSRTSKNQPHPQQFSSDLDNKIDTSYQNESSGYNFAGRTSIMSSGDTKPNEYNVTTSTAVATIPRGGGTTKPSSLLNASASAGGASGKVGKKRARASRKPPTTVLEADSSNFRAMVQQLTGIPALPFLSGPSLHHRNGLEFLDLVRPSSKSLLGFGAPGLQGLPPLDTFGRGQPHLHSSDTPFSPPYFKYMSAPQRQPPSMGDFLRTPLDELGLDNTSQQLLNSLEQQQQQQQQQQPQEPQQQPKIDPSMPLLWDGNENSRELQLEEISKYKLTASGSVAEVAGDEIGDHDGSSSRMARIVDSWLSHADPGADTSRSNNNNNPL